MKKDHPEDWNPHDVSVLKDQRQAHDDLRERCPVTHSELMGWSLFRHEDITNVLADPETYSNESKFLAIPNGMNPPVLGHYRKALSPNFSQERLAKLEPRIREIAVNLLVPLLSKEETEFNGAFAAPFTLKALCAFLGWPEQLWGGLYGWICDSQQAAFNKDPVAGKALADFFAEQVKANLELHRASPDEVVDSTDLLLATEVEGARLSDEQIVSVLRNWAAGHGTVVAGLRILALNLAQEPELQDRLRNEPALIPAAIEEILRVDGPLVANRRTTTREVKIQGRTIPKGETLSLMWMAANRDPRVFAEPNIIKLDRDTGASLAWGKGIHFCSGAPLARLELRVALEELLSRTKHFKAPAGDPRRAACPGSGLALLPLRFS